MPYESSFKDDLITELYQAILLLENLDECNRFFEDVCTIKELQSISQRLHVAKLLYDNITYTEIEKESGASTATISRISKCLHYGPGGYDMILKKLGYKKEE